MIVLLPGGVLFQAEWPSWSDESTAPSESSTPPSSIGSPFDEATPLPLENTTQLPSPFYPPSLVQQDPEHNEKCVEPRVLPSTLQCPEAPSLKACKGIDASDMYVLAAGCI
jgi:nitrate reductase (NAD(P)H)